MSFYFNNIALEVYFDERDAWSVIKYIKTSSWSVWLIDATFYAMQIFFCITPDPTLPHHLYPPGSAWAWGLWKG